MSEYQKCSNQPYQGIGPFIKILIFLFANSVSTRQDKAVCETYNSVHFRICFTWISVDNHRFVS